MDYDLKQRQHAATFVITVIILVGLGYVTYCVMREGTDGLKNIIVQAWIILTSGAAGFWFGTTKSAADQATTLQRVLAQQPPPTAPLAAPIQGDPSDPNSPAVIK